MAYYKRSKPYIARYYSHCATSLLLIVWVYLYSNFLGGLRKRMYFETECEIAVQGHPRLLTSVAIKGALCNFLLVINSNLDPTFPRFSDIIGFLLRIWTPTLFHRNFRGVPLGVDYRCCGSEAAFPLRGV